MSCWVTIRRGDWRFVLATLLSSYAVCLMLAATPVSFLVVQKEPVFYYHMTKILFVWPSFTNVIVNLKALCVNYFFRTVRAMEWYIQSMASWVRIRRRLIHLTRFTLVQFNLNGYVASVTEEITAGRCWITHGLGWISLTLHPLQEG